MVWRVSDRNDPVMRQAPVYKSRGGVQRENPPGVTLGVGSAFTPQPSKRPASAWHRGNAV